jgi:transcriptional regulator with XRE-family HTH domain
MGSRLDPGQAKLLGAQIKLSRQRRALSLQDAAALCGMHHSQLSRLERGQFKRLSQNVQTACELLHIRPHESVAPSAGVARLHARLDALVSRNPKSADVLVALLDALDSLQQRV